MMVEVGDPGRQAQEFLCSFFPLEAKLRSLLTPCGTVSLFNEVLAPGCRDDLLVVDVSQARNLLDGGSIIPELIRMNDLWNAISTQQSGQEGLRSFGIATPLKKNVEHETVLVYRTPEPMPDTSSRRTELIQIPLRTPPGFSVTQFVGEQGTEFDAPVAKGLVTDLLGRAGGAVLEHLGR